MPPLSAVFDLYPYGYPPRDEAGVALAAALEEALYWRRRAHGPHHRSPEELDEELAYLERKGAEAAEALRALRSRSPRAAEPGDAPEHLDYLHLVWVRFSCAAGARLVRALREGRGLPLALRGPGPHPLTPPPARRSARPPRTPRPPPGAERHSAG